MARTRGWTACPNRLLNPVVHLGSRFRPIGVIAERLRDVRIAQDRVLGGTVVLKYAPEGTAEARFLREEARLLADLEHHRLARLVCVFSDATSFDGETRVSGLATAWVDGDPFSAAASALPLDERIAAFVELLDGVSYLHRRGVLHLDLKPDNVLIGDQGCVLLDLGSSRPIDAGPGEAGGTLGYAAPEVLLGDGASVAADLYSLGVLLYTLLTDAHPFAHLGGRELRDAVLAEEPPPVRALRPDVARPLARLAEDLLARDPVRRPRDVDEVARRLAVAGFEARLTLGGAPGFAGRAQECRALAELLEDRAALVAVVGETGSGRSRLVRRVLAGAPEVALVDLSGAAEGAEALERFLAHREPLGQGAVLFLGRREDRSAADLAALDARVSALATGGDCVIWASAVPIPGASLVPVAPLEAEDLGRIARDFGCALDGTTRMAIAGSGGSPRALTIALTWSPARVASLAAPLREAWEAIATLPSGIPAEVLRACPVEIRDGIERLGPTGLVRIGPRGGVTHHVPDAGQGPIAAAVRSAAEQFVGGPAAEAVPLWSAVVAARLGLSERARSLLELPSTQPRERRALRRFALEMLWRDGDLAAARELAALLPEVGAAAQALEIARALPRDGTSVWLECEALSRLTRAQDAIDVAEAWLAEDPDDGRLWASLCAKKLALEDMSGAEAALARARATTRPPPPVQQLDLELWIAVARARAGANDAPAVARRVDELGLDPEAVPAKLLLVIGKVYSAAGREVDGIRILTVAMRKADLEGDLARGTVARLNRATYLYQIERGGEARPLFAEALLLGRALGMPGTVLRALYGLAAVDLGCGRVTAAERHIWQLEEAAVGSTDPIVAPRITLLRGQLAGRQERHEDAIAALSAITDATLGPTAVTLIARSLLALGRPEEALERLRATSPPLDPEGARRRAALEGRALMALARKCFAQALADLPEEPLDAMVRTEVGEVLLAAAGEDLDPETFAERRRGLGRAAGLLRGDDAARAATLRDRLLPAPGAALERIVELTEAMHDPAAFPETLARLVNEALGAHRVLIMLRIPGLGRQMTWRELSGQEAAGISHEVLSRLQKADDVWLADEAFTDPVLREASLTVRTFKIRSLLAVAIPRDDRAVGALYVDDLHRAGRFSQHDVAILQRLARAVGHLLGVLGSLTAREQQPLADPTDVLGVLLTRPDQIAHVETTLRQLRGQRETNVLVTGPTGAGKTWFARRLATDVLGLDGIVEVVLRKGDVDKLVSALSGTRRGQFTGAVDQAGAVERAIRERKALFLDEIQTLDEHGQQVLLPLLELPHRRFGDLTGPTKRTTGPLHVILGTNVDVAGNRWSDHFREDLWWRMSWAHVHLPALGERGPEVVYRYLAGMLASEGNPPPEEVMDIAALHRVTSHEWHGNLRELQRFATKVTAAWRDLRHPIGVADLPACGIGVTATPEAADSEAHALESTEREVILNALRRANWCQKQAAELLGITKDMMFRRVRRHGLLEEIRMQRGPVGSDRAARRARRAKKASNPATGKNK